MIDIEKEKIVHEKHLLSQGVDFKYLPNIQYNELENIYELIEWDEEYSEALNEINSSWCTWQAAKAHEAEKLKGWVVVPLNNTTIVAIERMVEQQVEASGITDDVFRLDGEKILNAAVEAQEPDND